MNDYQKIKQSVDQAKTSSAEISGQIKQMILTLNNLGFESENPYEEASKYLDDQEPILEQQEKNDQKRKSEIIQKYKNIIQETSPGMVGVEND